MILFFDSETTGAQGEDLALEDERQPHVVQLAAELCRDDGDVVSAISIVVNPGVPIPDGASKVHGITDEIARQFGVQPAEALAVFKALYTPSTIVVAHNFAFDHRMMQALMSRVLGAVHPFRRPSFCTMEASAPILNLPPSERMIRAGRTNPKSPRLGEAYKFFFGDELQGAHDAFVDTKACRRIFFALVERGAGPQGWTG